MSSPSRGEDVTVYVFDMNQTSLPTPFYSVLVSNSVFIALSTAFNSINSPDISPSSHSVLLVLSLCPIVISSQVESSQVKSSQILYSFLTRQFILTIKGLILKNKKHPWSLVLSTVYLFRKVYFRQDIIPSG